MDRNTGSQPGDWNGEGELPDVPDAGDGAQPLVPPNPIDISSSTIAADGAQLAGTLGDDRTLYEQALEVYEDDHDRTGTSREVVEGDRDTGAAEN